MITQVQPHNNTCLQPTQPQTGSLGQHKVAPVSNFIGCLGMSPIIIGGIVLWALGAKNLNPDMLLAGKLMVSIPLGIDALVLTSFCSAIVSGAIAG